MGNVISLCERRKAKISIPDRVDQGVRWYELGLKSQAEAAWRSVLDDDPNQSAASYNIAYMRQSENQPDRAIEMFKRSIQATPNFADAHYNIALCYMRLCCHELAASHFEKFIELAPGDPFVKYALDYLGSR